MRNSNAPEFRGGMTSGRAALWRAVIASAKQPHRTDAALGVATLARHAPVLRFSAAAAISALVLAAMAAGLHARAAALRPFAWTHAPPPHFTLPDLAGGTVTLAARKGVPVLVHFFATWCEPCREELPALHRLAERARSRLDVIAISVAEPDIRVRRFFQATPVGFSVLLDRDRSVAKAWRITTLPTTFVLDATLDPRLVAEGDHAWDTLAADDIARELTRRPASDQPNHSEEDNR